MPADTVVLDATYKLDGKRGAQRVLLYRLGTMGKGKYLPPLELNIGKRVQVVSGPFEPGNGAGQVNVNLRGQFFRVYVLVGGTTAVEKEGYVPASLFESGRFVLDGRG